MMFSVPLMCCDYRNVSLLKRVQPSQRDTNFCDSAYNESTYALCIQPSVLELSMNSNMCAPCVSCTIVMYIGIDYARDSNMFSVSFLCHSDGFIYRHSRPFLCILQCHICRHLNIVSLLV